MRLELFALATMVMVGCAPDEGVAPVQGWGSAPVEQWDIPANPTTGPPLVDPVVCVPPFLVPGEAFAFEASNLNPGENVVFIRGTGLGAGPCPAALGGLCIDLLGATVMGNAVAQLDGVATFTGTLPAAVSPSAMLRVQAVVARGPGGIDSVKSDVVRADVSVDYILPGNCASPDVCVYDDGDGDGAQDACDVCPADNPDDTDVDGVCDSDDPCPLDNPDDSDGDGYCDSDTPGCTDPAATNYDPAATVDDGSCILLPCIGTFATLNTQADVMNYAGCTELDAVYAHITTGLFDVDLPNLQHVNDYVYFHQNVDVTRVSLPNLKTVDGYVYFHENLALAEVDLCKLRSVGDYAYFLGNSALCVPDIDWPSITDDLTDSGNAVCGPDPCPVDPDDLDGDGVPNADDICPGGFDDEDADGDGVPDFCDICPSDSPDDTDGDGVCDTDDPCPLDNPDDADGDGYCDSEILGCADPLATNYDPAATIDDGSCVFTPMCIGTFATLNTQYDVPKYALCTELDAVYAHITSGVVDVNLPLLERVNDYVYFHQNADITRVSLPLLEYVDGYLYFHENLALAQVDLCSLRDVGDYAYFWGNSALCVPDLDWASITTDFTDVGNAVCAPTSCPVDPTDLDGDGVPNTDDICPGGFDDEDADGDGVPDFCDTCPSDFPDDTDGDGVCDTDDPCPLDNPDDSDGDGFCDSEILGCADPLATNYDPAATVDDGSCLFVDMCIGTFATLNSQYDVPKYALCTELDAVYAHITSGLLDVDLPLLAHVNDYVYFHQNADVTRVSLPSLTSVDGYVYFHENLALSEVNLDSIATVGDYVYFWGNAALCVPEIDWSLVTDDFTDSGNGTCPP